MEHSHTAVIMFRWLLFHRASYRSSVEYDCFFLLAFVQNVLWKTRIRLHTFFLSSGLEPTGQNNGFTMSYKSFKEALDRDLRRIKTALPKNFTSTDFIKVAKDCFPDEYATILRRSNYRTLHVWIARWYLHWNFEKGPDNTWRRGA